MLSTAEQSMLENICKESGTALVDIHNIIGKVYDEELAYDLNVQAARYSRFREKAAGRLLERGIVPQPVSILERTKRWTAVQAGTALNVSTGHVADLMCKEEEKRIEQMQASMKGSDADGGFSCELAEEFLEFEKDNMRILKSYCEPTACDR